MDTQAITCPSCFQVFEVAITDIEEGIIHLDYDCEVCCRPMVIDLFPDGSAEARSLDDL